MLAKEIERAGIATVFVTSLPTIATMIGANRIVRGPAITHPFGLDEAERRRIVERALEMLETEVEPTTVWEVEPDERRVGRRRSWRACNIGSRPAPLLTRERTRSKSARVAHRMRR